MIKKINKIENIGFF